MVHKVLHIDGMHCGACIRRVTQSLQAVPGAEVEEVRLGAARLKVADDTSIRDLVGALHQAGFAAREEN